VIFGCVLGLTLAYGILKFGDDDDDNNTPVI